MRIPIPRILELTRESYQNSGTQKMQKLFVEPMAFKNFVTWKVNFINASLNPSPIKKQTPFPIWLTENIVTHSFLLTDKARTIIGRL